MKKCEFMLHGNSLALVIDGEIDRLYKIDPKFRDGIVSDMKFCGYEPVLETLVAFPWLREHFMGDFDVLTKCEGCGDWFMAESFIGKNGGLVVECGGCGRCHKAQDEFDDGMALEFVVEKTSYKVMDFFAGGFGFLGQFDDLEKARHHLHLARSRGAKAWIENAETGKRLDD